MSSGDKCSLYPLLATELDSPNPEAMDDDNSVGPSDVTNLPSRSPSGVSKNLLTLHHSKKHI